MPVLPISDGASCKILCGKQPQPHCSGNWFYNRCHITWKQRTGTAKIIAREVYNLLDKNKEAFIIATTEEMAEPVKSRGQDNSLRLLKILKANQKNTQQLTDEQEQYLQNVIHKLENGSLPRQNCKKT